MSDGVYKWKYQAESNSENNVDNVVESERDYTVCVRLCVSVYMKESERERDYIVLGKGTTVRIRER